MVLEAVHGGSSGVPPQSVSVTVNGWVVVPPLTPSGEMVDKYCLTAALALTLGVTTSAIRTMNVASSGRRARHDR
jgi:hypothetical protein